MQQQTSRTGIFWLFFSPAGRISRLVFWLAYLLMFCVMFLAFNTATIGVFDILPEEVTVEQVLVAILESNPLLPIMLLISKWCELAINVKRLHDNGYSGFFAVLSFVPYLNFLLILVLGIMPGQKTLNRFGPCANSRN